MIEQQIAAGAAVLVGSISFGALLSRWVLAPVTQPGRHRARAPKRVVEYVPAAEIVPGFDQPYGALAPTGIAHCRGCGRNVAVVMHPGGAHRCEHGHINITTTGD